MNTLYTFTTPLFRNSLAQLSALLKKGQAFVEEHHLDEKAFLDERLAPDMFPLLKQVQIACDNAKGAVARLANVDIPKHEDAETTFSELQERISKTLMFIDSVPEVSFEGAEERHIELSYFEGKYLLGTDYVTSFVLPNFYFHMTTAYAILRHKGVSIGKMDFLAPLPLKAK